MLASVHNKLDCGGQCPPEIPLGFPLCPGPGQAGHGALEVDSLEDIRRRFSSCLANDLIFFFNISTASSETYF